MKKCFLVLSFLACEIMNAGAQYAAPVTLANPLQGTVSRDGFSHGNTYPEIALPFTRRHRMD